ncbi:MAG: hypothetical protein R2845_11415 [Thermomicrobiales bacterium]
MGDRFFQDTSRSTRVIPGVLIVEAIAQVGAVAMLGLEEHSDKIAFFAGIDNVRFKRQVKPGDVAATSGTQADPAQHRHRLAAFATVDGEVACV